MIRFFLIALVANVVVASAKSDTCTRKSNYVVTSKRLQVDPGEVFHFDLAIQKDSICHQSTVQCRLEVVVPDGAVYMSDSMSYLQNRSMKAQPLSNSRQLLTWQWPEDVKGKKRKTASKFQVSFSPDVCAPLAELVFEFSLIASRRLSSQKGKNKPEIAKCVKSTKV